MFYVGQKVIVNPPMTPNLFHHGEILRKTKNGWSVKYNVNDMWFKDTFTAKQIISVAIF